MKKTQTSRGAREPLAQIDGGDPMTKLTYWIPERWRDTFANLRDEVVDRVERWLLGRRVAPVRSRR